jgi:hypothetical protein
VIVTLLTLVLGGTGLVNRCEDPKPRTVTAVVTVSVGQDTSKAAPKTPEKPAVPKEEAKPAPPKAPEKPKSVKISISDDGITVGDEDGTQHVILELDTEQLQKSMQKTLDDLDKIDLLTGVPESLAVYLQQDEDGGYVKVRGDAVVRFGKDIHIHRHELVQGDVVAIGGDVVIEGKVRGNVVSVLGSTTLESTAIVNGDVVTVLGAYEEDPAARVRGETVTVGTGTNAPNIVIPFFPAGGGILRLVGKIVSFIVGALLLMLFIYLLPDRVRRAGDHVFGSFFKSLGVGFLVVVFGMLFVAVIVFILSITIIGIPVAVLVALSFAALLIFGYFVSAFALGRAVCSRFDVCGTSPVLHGIIGLFLLSVLGILSALMWVNPFLVPLRVLLATLGKFVAFLAVLNGTGALIISRMGMKPTAQRPDLPAHMESIED